MRVILDTNVFISALFWGGKPRKALEISLGKEFQLVVSKDILDEYLNVAEILTKKYTPSRDPQELLDYIIRESILIEPVKAGPITADPKDDMFFEAALSSGAKLIISGDKHLHDKDGYQGISVQTAADFVRENSSAKQSGKS